MKDAELLLKSIKQALLAGLPGEVAQRKMLPAGRDILPIANPVEAAVLLLLFPKNEQWHIVFIKRNQYDGPHSGQVSFPGGKKDETDSSLFQTAIRETSEETGAIAVNDCIAGALTPLHIPVSGFVVHPFIAVLQSYPEFNPDRNEVDYLIEVPIKDILNPEHIKTKEIQVRNVKMKVPYFDVQNETIWGATAMILSEFMELLPVTIFD